MRKFPITELCVIAPQKLICRPIIVGTLFAPNQGLQFHVVHPLSFLSTCTLHWCNHCTVLEVTTNVRKFPITALCEMAADGVICGPVLVGTLLAPTQGLQFHALHPLSFLFTCNLHWCNHCTVLEVTTDERKFPITALCEIAADGVVCGPVLVGTLLAPTQGLQFQALHPLSFLFMCTLHWCKHCTVLEVTTNIRKFPMTALSGITAQRLICRPVPVGTLFAPTQGSHFQSLHPLSFLFIYTLHWCKHCTLLEITMNVHKLPMTTLCVIAARILIFTFSSFVSP